jgi:hypothetical protein
MGVQTEGGAKDQNCREKGKGGVKNRRSVVLGWGKGRERVGSRSVEISKPGLGKSGGSEIHININLIGSNQNSLVLGVADSKDGSKCGSMERSIVLRKEANFIDNGKKPPGGAENNSRRSTDARSLFSNAYKNMRDVIAPRDPTPREKHIQSLKKKTGRRTLGLIRPGTSQPHQTSGSTISIPKTILNRHTMQASIRGFNVSTDGSVIQPRLTQTMHSSYDKTGLKTVQSSLYKILKHTRTNVDFHNPKFGKNSTEPTRETTIRSIANPTCKETKRSYSRTDLNPNPNFRKTYNRPRIGNDIIDQSSQRLNRFDLQPYKESSPKPQKCQTRKPEVLVEKNEIGQNLNTKSPLEVMFGIGIGNDEEFGSSGIESPLGKGLQSGGEGREFGRIVGISLLGKSLEKKITENFCPVGSRRLEVLTGKGFGESPVSRGNGRSGVLGRNKAGLGDGSRSR